MKIINKKLTRKFKVTKNRLAKNVHSGGFEVLATPSLIAHFEKTAHELLKKIYPYLESVGYIVNIKHLKPTKEKDIVKSVVEIIDIDNKKVKFDIKCFNNTGKIILKGEHVRALVDPSSFMNF